MARRRGPSISLKMIITTTLLILIIVGLFGFINIVNVQGIYDDQSKKQEEIYETSTKQRGSSKIDDLSQGVIEPLKTNAYTTAQSLLLKAKASDVLVEHIWLLDDRGRRVASSVAGDNKQFNRLWEEDPEKVKAFAHELIPKQYEALLVRGAKSAAPAAMAAAMQPAMAPPKKAMGAMEAAMGAGMEAPKAATSRPAAAPGVWSRTTKYKGERVMVVGKLLKAEGQKLGAMFIVYSLAGLKEQQSRLKRRKEKDFSKAWQYTAMIGGVFILLGLLLAIFQGFQISRPIKILTTRASQIAQGDLQTRVEVVSSDELGLLAENFNFMADQLLILLTETATKAEVQKELAVARGIQERLVPTGDVVDRPFLRLAGYFEPASECGGDWWTFHDLKDGKVLVVIADVTGHGVPSAMITATAKSAVDTLRAVTKDELTVTYLLEILNRAILESAQRKFVMTCFASIIDPKNHTITFANAGHNFPYLVRKQNGRTKFNVLMTRGNRLGDILESTYEAKQETLEPGDVLVWYTDGIVECESPVGEEYGEKRFRNSIRKLGDSEPDSIRDGIIEAATGFFADMPHKDDITMVVGKYYEPGTAPPLTPKPGTEAEGAPEAPEATKESPA